MSSQHLPLPLSQLAIALMAASAPAWAAPPTQRQQPPPQQSQAQAPPRQKTNDELSNSVRRVQRDTRGQILSAERVPYDGRSINRIKVVDDRGRVRVYVDDPQQDAPDDDGGKRPPRTRREDD